MTIKSGDKIPAVTLKQLSAGGMQDVSTDSLFAGKKVVLFSVPGCFTPTCSAKHLPSFIQTLASFRELGVEVYCLAVNDPFVMRAWAEINKADGITMLPDGNATFTKALGLEMDGSAHGLGLRSQRFALYAENGIVKHVAIEKTGRVRGIERRSNAETAEGWQRCGCGLAGICLADRPHRQPVDPFVLNMPVMATHPDKADLVPRHCRA